MNHNAHGGHKEHGHGHGLFILAALSNLPGYRILLLVVVIMLLTGIHW